MEQRRTGGSVGLASVLMIVMILALTCFGVLALASARADAAVSARAAQFSAGYYAAEGRLQRQLAGLDARLQAGDFAQQPGTVLETLVEPLGEAQELRMQVAVTPRQREYRVLSCALAHTEDWEPDGSLELWDGGQ